MSEQSPKRETGLCAVVANLPLAIMAFILTKLAVWMAGESTAAWAGGALILLTAGFYSGSELRTRLTTQNLHSALRDRNFRDALFILVFFIPGPLLGWSIALIT